MNNFELAARQRRRDAIWAGAIACAMGLGCVLLGGYLIAQLVCGPYTACSFW